MQFEKEVGAIIAENGGLINIFDGHHGHVDFPDEMIARMHEMRPGYIDRFTHTHPPGIGMPSNQDDSMMRNLAMVMYPFPVRLGIIVPTHASIQDSFDPYHNTHQFTEHIYQWVFEPREIWQVNKIAQNDIKRAIALQRIKSRMFSYTKAKNHSWEDWVIERSYDVF